MQVRVDRKFLLNVVSKVKLAAVTNGYSTLPILSCFKLEAGQGHLTITGGNLQHFLIGSCEGKVLKVGAGCVEAKSLEAFLKASSADEVRLSVEAKKLRIEAGVATATLEAKDAADYPPIPQVKGKPLTIMAFDQVIALWAMLWQLRIPGQSSIASASTSKTGE